MKVTIKIVLLLITCCSLNAKIGSIVKQNYEDGDFKLVLNNIAADILYDQNDYKVVHIAANDLAKDIASVSGKTPSTYTDWEKIKGSVVVIGTIGHNKLIDQLIKEGKVDFSNIAGKWETYSIQIVEKPLENIASALVIFGSDRRGTAFGVYELSKQIGVSPWYWWADVPVEKKSDLVIQKGFYAEGPPSVKYRGIFINDEDWGLKPWATKTFDPELGDIGPKTYKKVFELLLRLKANHCWPAMHYCTKPFNYYKENKQVADDYAIVMGSAHCEPLLFNNASEWDTKTMGQWRYDTNKENIYKVLDKRVCENGQFENIYTVGLRGLHDSQMIGNLSIEKQVALLEQVFADQRKILASHINKEISQIPQVFIPYKEVLTLYNNGLKVPDDVTLMWVDDNFGYIRRLSNPIESNRSGGAGVYYHLSYLGPPGEWLWLSTMSPALVWEEMKKAYDFNARQIWIANVGDIKPCEYGTSFFLDLAWDVNMVDHSNVSSHLGQWLSDIFGKECASQITPVMAEYYSLCFQRKPEHMGFGEEWALGDLVSRWQDTEFSFENYTEAERRLERFERIHAKADEIRNNMPDKLKPVYFQLVYYPVAAADLMNRKILLAQKNRWYAKQARNSTNHLGEQVQSSYEKIQQLTDEYNSLLNGKWKYLMSVKQCDLATYYNMPPLEKIEVPKAPHMGIFAQNSNVSIDSADILPCFNAVYDKKYFIEIFNTGQMPFTWAASPDRDWIKLSKSKGEITDQDRIYVSIDWTLVPKGTEMLKGQILFEGGDGKKTVYVNCFNPALPVANELKGVFVEDNGVISINASNYSRKVESGGIKLQVIDGIGSTGKLVMVSPVTAPARYPDSNDVSRLEYSVFTYNSGIVAIDSYLLPVCPSNSFRSASYGISIDERCPQLVDIATNEYDWQWKVNIRRNVSKTTTRHYLAKPGKHTVKLWMRDPGMAFDKIVIDLGGLKMSYLGPEETQVK